MFYIDKKEKKEKKRKNGFCRAGLRTLWNGPQLLCVFLRLPLLGGFSKNALKNFPIATNPIL